MERCTIMSGDSILHELRTYKEQQNEYFRAIIQQWNNHSFIFSNKLGNSLYPSNLRLDFNRTTAKADFRKPGI